MRTLVIAFLQCVLGTVIFYVMVGAYTDFSDDFFIFFIEVFPLAIAIKLLNFFAGSKKM